MPTWDLDFVHPCPEWRLRATWQQKITLAITTDFDAPNGVPTSAKVTINNNSAITWYTGLGAIVPKGEHDLFTVLNHEIAHALGFTISYNSFEGNVSGNEDGTRTYNSGGIPTATLTPPLDGTHTDATAHPNDLMNTGVPKGVTH